MNQLIDDLRMFWWAIAVRGGLALILAVVLFFASTFLGIFFFDPVTFVYISLLLGSFVLGNGLLLGIAAGFAYEHHLHVWWLMLCECCFALLLGVYIGLSLIMTRESLAFLAGLHALTTGLFQEALAVKLRKDSLNAYLLGFTGVVSLCVGLLFFAHIDQAARTTTQALAAFELLCGICWVSLSIRLRR
jgi:uncharacterized membrane protein HdeD (DUF308 family)